MRPEPVLVQDNELETALRRLAQAHVLPGQRGLPAGGRAPSHRSRLPFRGGAPVREQVAVPGLGLVWQKK